MPATVAADVRAQTDDVGRDAAAAASTPHATGSAPQRRRVSRFIRIVIGATVAVHLPVAAAVTALGQRFGWPHPALIGVAWAVFGVAAFVLRVRLGAPESRRHPLVVRLLDIPYFIHWSAAVWAFIPSVLAAMVALLAAPFETGPLHLPMAVIMWSYLSGLVACAYGILVRRRWFRVVERELAVPGLDARLDGLRIAQLSDLHIGALTPRSWGLAWAQAANRRAPDMAVVTGDLVTSGSAFYDDVADVVGALRAEQGVFVSMGNHDYFGGADGEALVARMRARDVRVLRNEGAAVTRAGATLWVAAIDDTWTHRDDLARALEGAPAGATTLVLAHDPERFDQAEAAGVQIVLSGHTHGGQVGVPFFYRTMNLASPFYRYTVGVYRRGRSVLYVHPGLGTTGPPIRLGVAPEVTVLTLRTVPAPAA